MGFLRISDRRKEMYRINIIGAGNVAYRMALFLQGAGHSIECVWARDIEKAEKVVRALKRSRSNVFATTDMGLLPKADITLIAVSDDAIANVAAHLPHKECFTVHTSGATPMSVLEEAGLKNAGVFYPLMTLSMNKDLDVRLVPFLIEANAPQGEEILRNITSSIKAEYKVCDSKKRLQFHTAAIFTTNFLNYSLSLAYDIASPDFTLLLPSAIESIRKAFLNTPAVSQTGPARRGDTNTITKHKEILSEERFKEHLQVYEFLTEKIFRKYNPDKQ
ncbi:MAG: DUF2520 domain-containing protein [Bacteroidales bacterium]|nr:DUF2520 domain-containing protein [Bacteroidales bacterium]